MCIRDRFVGDAEVGAAFSGLAFDHLIFTGGTSIAKHVMKAASENLVPLTLELGGKSPVVVGKDAKIKDTAQRVMQGKTMNAGQICLAPDYALVPEGKVDEFVKASVEVTSEMFPEMKDNDDFTSIINQRHYDRIQGYLDDAKEKGADIVEINPSNEDFSQQPHHKIPPTLVLNPSEDMKIMQEEIFGPVICLIPYSDVEQAIEIANDSEYGLSSMISCSDEVKGQEIAKKIRTGQVILNRISRGDYPAPFGGFKMSGNGREHGLFGIDEYLEVQAVIA